jgi:succinoglycan biosynthesis transport protein ExoP
VDLRHQLAVVRARFPFLVIACLLAAASAFVISSFQPKMYEGQTTLIVGQSLSVPNPDVNQILASQRLAGTYAVVATTRPVLQAVIDRLQLPTTADELASRVTADAASNSTLLSITTRDRDPTTAAAIANAIGDQLIAASPAIQGQAGDIQSFIDKDLKAIQQDILRTEAQIEGLEKLSSRTLAEDQQIETLRNRLVSLRATYATLVSLSSNTAANLVSVIEPAVPATSPASPRVLFNVGLAAILGLALGIAIVFMLEYLDDTLKTQAEIEQAIGLPTLGTIMRMPGNKSDPEMRRLATLLYPRSSAAEAFRALRTNIDFAAVDMPIQTLLVASAAGGEGKTTIAANLAVVFAQAGRRTVLVDGDLRKPGIHSLFMTGNDVGLTTLLVDDTVALDAVCHEVDDEPNLMLLPTGPIPPNPAELLGSQRMRNALDRIKKQFDLVILDSPPLRAVTDAAVLAAMVDATIMVVHARHTRRASVLAGHDALVKVGARVIGVSLNLVPRRPDTERYGAYAVHQAPVSSGREGATVTSVADLPRES